MLSRRTTVYPCSLIKLSISFNNRSLSGIRSCRRMIEPGRNLFWIRFKTFSLEGCSVSSVLIFQPTGVYPNMRTAFAIVGFVTPNGGRNNLIFCEVTRSNANWQACKSFFHPRQAVQGKMIGMGKRMITNQMSFVDNLSDQLLILFYFVTDAEETSRYLLFFEYLQYFGGLYRVRSIIKGDSYNFIFSLFLAKYLEIDVRTDVARCVD